MGYSTSIATVRKAAPVLQPLLSGQDFCWTGLPDPQGFAYKLRECLHIARQNPAEFPQLSKFAHKYRIEVLTGSVYARMIPDAGTSHPQPLTQNGTAASVVNNPSTVLEVVQAWLRQQPATTPILITDCHFTNAELERLEKWATQQQPAWKLEQTSDTSLTLSIA